MDVNDDQQELDTLDTLSLTDFPLTEDQESSNQDHKHGHGHPPSPTQDLFEFESSGLNQPQMKMSHAEDMISNGKLIPINKPPKTTQKHDQNRHIRHESMRELKTNTSKATTKPLFRNSYSLDSKKLVRNSKLNNEPKEDIYANRNSLSNKSSSARWTDLVFAPLKVPGEMDLKDIRNRQIGLSSSNRFSSSGAGDQNRKSTSSWGVLGFLSCKRSGSVAVTMPLS